MSENLQLLSYITNQLQTDAIIKAVESGSAAQFALPAGRYN